MLVSRLLNLRKHKGFIEILIGTDSSFYRHSIIPRKSPYNRQISEKSCKYAYFRVKEKSWHNSRGKRNVKEEILFHLGIIEQRTVKSFLDRPSSSWPKNILIPSI